MQRRWSRLYRHEFFFCFEIEILPNWRPSDKNIPCCVFLYILSTFNLKTCRLITTYTTTSVTVEPNITLRLPVYHNYWFISADGVYIWASKHACMLLFYNESHYTLQDGNRISNGDENNDEYFLLVVGVWYRLIKRHVYMHGSAKMVGIYNVSTKWRS